MCDILTIGSWHNERSMMILTIIIPMYFIHIILNIVTHWVVQRWHEHRIILIGSILFRYFILTDAALSSHESDQKPHWTRLIRIQSCCSLIAVTCERLLLCLQRMKITYPIYEYIPSAAIIWFIYYIGTQPILQGLIICHESIVKWITLIASRFYWSILSIIDCIFLSSSSIVSHERWTVKKMPTIVFIFETYSEDISIYFWELREYHGKWIDLIRVLSNCYRWLEHSDVNMICWWIIVWHVDD